MQSTVVPPLRALVVVLLLAGGAVRTTQAQDGAPATIDLFADLATDGLDRWTEHRLARRPSRYRVRAEDQRTLLQAESFAGNSALVRRISLPSAMVSGVAWRWRVAGSLTENRRERDKRGDDFAARVFVIFDAAADPWSGRAICYVWSGNLPVGTAYRSPYTHNVAMLVVETGDGRAREWVSVHRDVVVDYQRAFGGLPDSLTAVAIMVDTDNTRSHAAAWFDSLVIHRIPSRN